MYLVMDHMHRICYDFEHSSSIWIVTARIINLCYIILFYLFIFIYSIFVYFFIFLLLFVSPADNRIYLFVCSCMREMKIQMEKKDRHISRLCVHQ